LTFHGESSDYPGELSDLLSLIFSEPSQHELAGFWILHHLPIDNLNPPTELIFGPEKNSIDEDLRNIREIGVQEQDQAHDKVEKV
jgi:hypothetical protein